MRVTDGQWITVAHEPVPLVHSLHGVELWIEETVRDKLIIFLHWIDSRAGDIVPESYLEIMHGTLPSGVVHLDSM